MSSARSEDGRSSVASISRVVSTRSLSDLSEGDATLDALIRRHVPQAILVSRGPAELAFRLPKEETTQCALSYSNLHQMSNPTSQERTADALAFLRASEVLDLVIKFWHAGMEQAEKGRPVKSWSKCVRDELYSRVLTWYWWRHYEHREGLTGKN